MSRDRTIWVILVGMTLLSLIFMATRAIPLNSKWRAANERAENIQFGTDRELEEVIEYLESRLRSRNDYIFALEEEPLRLTNVLFLTDAYGRPLRYRRTGKLRVTAIIDGQTQRAIVNYKDRNFVVTVGDSVGKGEVVWIDSEEVIIVEDNKELHFQVSGLTPEEDMTSKNEQMKEN